MKTLHLSIVTAIGIAISLLVLVIHDVNAQNGTVLEKNMTISKHPAHMESPLEQFEAGITLQKIQCQEGLQLIIKAEDGSPACVKYTTANILIERGWSNETVSTMIGSETTVIIPLNSSEIFRGLTFTPQTVKVVIGANNTIRWINMDSVTNDITSDTGSFRSGLIESGYAWTHVFVKNGTYGYHSVIHPWFKGTVIVLPEIPENTKKLNPVIYVISISGTSSPPNPGGPEIQLKLMNIGLKPITNLNATLVLNNDYIFNFKDVTESNPLAPGHSASDTEILIGAGFRSELAYPIIISGIENNMPFRYTEDVYIHQ